MTNDDHAEEYITRQVLEMLDAKWAELQRELGEEFFRPRGYYGEFGRSRITDEGWERLKQPPRPDGPQYRCAVASGPVPARDAHPAGNRKQRLARASRTRSAR